MTSTHDILSTTGLPSFIRSRSPKLSVVGAGPGDPELLTLKALNTLKQANVVLYDALANPEILTYCNSETTTMFVGKRKGQPSISQDDINDLILRYACERGHVVRLKGGDPFVFGRGFEEILFAEQHGIATEYIPGISSAVGVAGLEGIPLTHRGVSESFWVITGSTSEREFSRDLHAAAQTNATVVVLMGLSNLAEIAEVFVEHGKETLPVAVIQNGSLPYARAVSGTVSSIVADVYHTGITPPAIIVLGEVVGLRGVAIS